MARIKQHILEKELHLNAAETVEEYVMQLADALILQSKTFAALEGSDEVQKIHVDKAKEKILTLALKRSSFQTVFVGIGSLFLGVGASGLFSEYGSTQRPEYFLVYSVCGIIGMGITVWAAYRN